MNTTERNTEDLDVGKILRSARLEKKLTLPIVSKELCITKSTLKNLEDNASQLKRDVYVVGHIRAYAEFLHLNADEIVREFKKEAAPPPPLDEKAFLMPLPQEGVPKSRILLGSAALALVIGFGLHYISGEDNPIVKEILAQVSDESVIVEETDEGLIVAETPDISPPEDTLSPASSERSWFETGAEDMSNDLPVDPVGNDISEAANPEVIAEDSRGKVENILLNVTEDSWVEIRNLMGDVVISKVFHPGDTHPLSVDDELILHTGNAGGVFLTFDGHTTPPLGESGQVLDNISLNPEKLLARYPKNQ